MTIHKVVDVAYRPKLRTDLHVRLSEPLLSSLHELAAESDRPLSRVVRQALEEYVARENGKSK